MNFKPTILLLFVLGLQPGISHSQGLIKKLKNKATETVNKVTTKKDSDTSETTSGNSNGSGSGSSRGVNDDSEGKAVPGNSGKTESMPGGAARTEKTLATLNKGEYIIADESTIKIGTPGGGNGYTLIVKSGNDFYAITESGRQGPFKQVPAELLPKRAATAGSGIYSFEELKGHSERDLGYTMEGKVLIKHEGKVIETLPAGTQYMGHYYDKKNNKLIYITMSLQGDKMGAVIHQPAPKKDIPLNTIMAQILQNPVTGELMYSYAAEDITMKYFMNEDGVSSGPYHQNSKAYALHDGKSYIVMSSSSDSEEGTTVYKDSKELYTLKGVNYDDAVIFNHDASAYVVASSGGLKFSEGSTVRTGILPTVERTSGGLKLHFLHINANKEVVQSTIPW
ncbi:hypothetical protein [Flavihumibacter sp.]|uniref:hypothetical protein n=1 Tax=Flavihumibacter sp. TaxID=1913981 RepID=UPI002FC96171